MEEFQEAPMLSQDLTDMISSFLLVSSELTWPGNQAMPEGRRPSYLLYLSSISFSKFDENILKGHSGKAREIVSVLVFPLQCNISVISVLSLFRVFNLFSPLRKINRKKHLGNHLETANLTLPSQSFPSNQHDFLLWRSQKNCKTQALLIKITTKKSILVLLMQCLSLRRLRDIPQWERIRLRKCRRPEGICVNRLQQ